MATKKKPSPKKPSPKKKAAEPAPAASPVLAKLETLAEELGAEAYKSALISRDYHFYKREKALDVNDLPHHYWDSAYKRKLVAEFERLPKRDKSAIGSLDALLPALKERYLKVWFKKGKRT